MPIIPANSRQGSSLKGEDHGGSVSLILDESEPGQGPRLHRHPYDETWVVQEGHLTLQLGDAHYQISSGDIAIVPPGVPHKFTNAGPGRSKLVCIHANATFIGEWLE
jgi:quercetin dioxygenase-like cupin family protein